MIKNIKKFLKNVVTDIKTKKRRGLLILVLALVAGLLWGFSSGLLWLLFLSFWVYGWDNRIIAVFALLGLFVCPILLAFQKNIWAENLAVYIFFFLVMVVFLQIIEFGKNSKITRIKIQTPQKKILKKRKIMNDIIINSVINEKNN